VRGPTELFTAQQQTQQTESIGKTDHAQYLPAKCSEGGMDMISTAHLSYLKQLNQNELQTNTVCFKTGTI
jgi:hypothetical protein